MVLSLLAEGSGFWLQYATVVVWLLVVLFASYAVYKIWAGLISHAAMTWLLLPGALVSELAFVLGCLLSGATVKDVSLVPRGREKKDEQKDKKKDEEAQKRESAPPVRGGFPKPKLPVIGHIFMGLIPIFAAGVCIWAASAALGHPILTHVEASLPQTLPTTTEGWWALPNELIAIVRKTWESLTVGRWTDFQAHWKTILFVYLSVCLIVRMAPIRGNLRGAAGAMLLLGGVAIGVELIHKGATTPMLEKSWMLLTFTVGMLLLLLTFSLLALALVGLLRLAFVKTA